MTKIFYFIIFSLICSPYVQASQAGKVTFVRGKVLYKTKSLKTTKVFKGMIFDEKSSFQTSKRSLIILSLNDGSKIKLGSKSKIHINNLNSNTKPTTASLISGDAFFSVLKSKLRNKTKFKVRTRTAALGVRGTSFYVSYGKDKINNDIWMCVNSGLVSVRAKNVKKVTLVKKGQGVQIANADTISKPRALPWTQKLNWNMSPKKGNVSNNINIEDAYLDLLDQDYD